MKVLIEKREIVFENLNEILNYIKLDNGVKFNESIDVAIKLGINPTKSDENVRGNFDLIYGITKNPKIIAFVLPEEEAEVRKIGVETIGLLDLVEEIKKNDKIGSYDYAFASTKAFPSIVSIAKILGKNGLMPNKKDGTLSDNISDAILKCKSGKRCIFRNDDAGCVNFSIGKKTMSIEELKANLQEAIEYIKSLKPTKVKQMIKRIFISSTMGLSAEIPLRFI